MKTINTVTLRNGVQVLAKSYHDEFCAVTYANRTQAYKKVEKLGMEWAVYRPLCGRVFYVALLESLQADRML